MDRTTWLDGLRGIAAAIVALDHYFMGGVLDVAFRSFWADPPEDNRRFIQLPPIRLLFASHAMVPLFLVISGYAISINLLRARNNSSVSSAAAAAAAASCEGDFVRRLSSAATRRIFRIYLPVVAIASISQLLYFCNLYRWDFGDEVVWGRRPWTAPWLHVTFLTRYILDIMNIIQFHNNPGLNGQLWTMPFEFRGSCIVYLTILALAFWRPSFRRWALVGMMAYFFHYGLWDIFAFLAGLYLAEMKLASGETQSAELKLLPDYRRTCSSLAAAWKTRIKSFNLARIRTVISFAFGFHLICLSDDGYLPPGYQFLARFQSSRWDDDWAVLSKCWKAAGAVLLVYAIDKSSSLQRALNVRAVQYLGRISFSLYLVHQSVYHLARDPVRDFIWWILTRSPYSSTEEASRTAIVPFGLAWIGGFLVMGAVVVYLADLYTRYVDVRCVALARMVERWVTGRS